MNYITIVLALITIIVLVLAIIATWPVKLPMPAAPEGSVQKVTHTVALREPVVTVRFTRGDYMTHAVLAEAEAHKIINELKPEDDLKVEVLPIDRAENFQQAYANVLKDTRVLPTDQTDWQSSEAERLIREISLKDLMGKGPFVALSFSTPFRAFSVFMSKDHAQMIRQKVTLLNNPSIKAEIHPEVTTMTYDSARRLQ